jgi:arylsulfatase
VSDGLFDQLDLFATILTLAGVGDQVPDDRFVDAVDQTSFLLAPDGESNRKFHYYWLTSNFSALRVGEYKYMLSSISDNETDVVNPGGFTGTLQQYPYGRLFNLFLDPKETHSYLIRKLVYIELIQRAVGEHLRTFRDFPARPSPMRRG